MKIPSLSAEQKAVVLGDYKVDKFQKAMRDLLAWRAEQVADRERWRRGLREVNRQVLMG